MKTVIIVQARMTSTRLTGKVLKQVLGKPLLEYQLERLQRVKLADQIVLATTTNEGDRPIIELCDRLSIPYFRGSELDVLSRYYETALAHQADAVVRVTSDCPLIDPAIIDRVIAYYFEPPVKYDYVSNALNRTYPRGMDTEVFSFKALREAHFEATAPPDREHVTSFIYRNLHQYRIGHQTYFEDWSHYRWTVDTIEDFELVKRMLESLIPKIPEFTLEDCLGLIQQHPKWQEINQHIEQKVV